MPVEHMVWIKFKAGVTDDRIAQHLAGLKALEGKVPGILRIAVGANFTDRAAGYGHGLLVQLEDRASLKVYAEHPEHVAVAGPLRADAELMAMDFEHDGD